MKAPLWTPTDERIQHACITQFQKTIEQQHEQRFDNYAQLHQWSITHPELFWQQIWQFCGIQASAAAFNIVEHAERFPGASWFPGSRLNFAENLLRYRDGHTAIVSLQENGQRRHLSYRQLYEEVARLASAMRKAGVTKGDRVAGFMPNIPESVIAMLATSSIGAIWSSCSPDFGLQCIIDRFGQIEPKLLFVADTYYYNGKTIDCRVRIAEIQHAIASIEQIIVINNFNDDFNDKLSTELSTGSFTASINYADFIDQSAAPAELDFTQLPFDHPLYILYSSGTTGVPKCIVHSAGGTLIQHLKELQLHTDVSRDSVLFYFTTCGWMMWNWLVSGLACGCTVVLYDGSPLADKGRILLDAIDDEQISIFGASARYIAALEKQGHKPRETHKLHSLKTILSTGAPLSPESFAWVYRNFKTDVCLSSISGGTDIVSCFALGNPTLPVYAGQLQCLGLGMAVEIWNEDGKPLIEQKGELVCTRSFPSCPLGFWTDTHGEKFHDAYFARFANVGAHGGSVWAHGVSVWAHGDYGEITAENGLIIHGRSDAVLNPGGVRIGTAEIYRQVEKIPAVLDSIAVAQQWRGDERIILFVVLADDAQLSDALIDLIKQTIRTHASPRHVPAKILQVNDIPRTISGKIVELAVRNVIHDLPVKNTGALENPQTLAFFRNRPELLSD